MDKPFFSRSVFSSWDSQAIFTFQVAAPWSRDETIRLQECPSSSAISTSLIDGLTSVIMTNLFSRLEVFLSEVGRRVTPSRSLRASRRPLASSEGAKTRILPLFDFAVL